MEVMMSKRAHSTQPKDHAVDQPAIPFPVLSLARSYRMVDFHSGKTVLETGTVIRATRSTGQRLMKWEEPDTHGHSLSWRHIDQLYPVDGPEYPSRVEA